MRCGISAIAEPERRRAVLLPLLAAGITFGAIAVGHGLGDGRIEQALLAARYTARAAFALFLVVYLAGPAATLWPGAATVRLSRDRRWWGLAFATAHFIHLGALIRYFAVSGVMPEPLTLYGGGFGYLVLAAMVATSTDGACAMLGAWWQRLHVFGLHYIWFVFAFSYFGRLFDPARREQGFVLFPIALAALAVRLVAARRRA